jgi:hypothetical protein
VPHSRGLWTFQAQNERGLLHQFLYQQGEKTRDSVIQSKREPWHWQIWGHAQRWGNICFAAGGQGFESPHLHQLDTKSRAIRYERPPGRAVFLLVKKPIRSPACKGEKVLSSSSLPHRHYHFLLVSHDQGVSPGTCPVEPSVCLNNKVP